MVKLAPATVSQTEVVESHLSYPSGPCARGQVVKVWPVHLTTTGPLSALSLSCTWVCLKVLGFVTLYMWVCVSMHACML